MRNDLYNRVVKLLHDLAFNHRYCEDGWYACPKNAEYAGNETECNCHAEEAQKLLDDLTKGPRG